MAAPGADTVRAEFDAICRHLNMDLGTMDVAWKSYTDLKEFYTLEGDQHHWLACALFVACRTVVIPTVDGGDNTTGNRVTLYNIIRETKISLLEFFERMKRWVEMALKHGLPKEVPTLVESLEHRFRVITLIYRKYDGLFQAVFATPSEEHRRKARPKCSAADLHKFVWTLFVHARACLNGVQDNLVNSFHLLICVVETMYLSAIQADRQDLINQEFRRTVDAITADDPTKEKEVVDYLCQRYEADLMEVKVIREHWWERHLEDIKEKETLPDRLYEIVEGTVFHRNSKKLNRAYEAYVMSVGDLDERVFLGAYASEEVGTPIKVASGSSVISDKMRPAPKNLDRLFANASAGVAPCTPLTGADARMRNEFRSPLATPVSSAMYNMSRIRNIVSNPQQIGARLPKLCMEIDPNLYDAVKKRVEKIKGLFVEKYRSAGSGDRSSQQEGETICEIASTIYFKVLEAVAADEYQKRGKARLLNLFQTDDLHLAMIGCCLQIVLTSKNTSDKMFPWIMEALDIPAYSFARVIESIIHFEPKLSSSMVKSLKTAEEQLLESLVWRTGSPVFDQVREMGKVYRFHEVALPDTTAFNQNIQHHPHQSVMGSPLPLSQRRMSARKLTFDDETPKVQTTAASTSSKSTNTTISLRTLSEAAALVDKGMDNSSSSEVNSTATSLPSGGVQSSGASSTTPPTSDDTVFRGNQAAAAASGETLPVKNALALFLRKVYHLASMRLQFLCTQLRMSDEEQQMCWTCFEELLVNHLDEMQDRHVDQFIMCSIYAIGKILRKKDVEFADIVKFYKKQPHSRSATYRQVMICRKSDDASSNSNATAAEPAAEPTSDEQNMVVPEPKAVKEQKEVPSPKGSPATRASRRRQEQLRQEQLKQVQVQTKQGAGTPPSPRRSPRKRPHDSEGNATTSAPVPVPARRSLFTSTSPPTSKRIDFGGSNTETASLRRTPPPSSAQGTDSSAASETAMDTGEPKAKRTPRSAPPGLLSPAVALPDGQCIGDIISFYNKVYLSYMKEFLLRFTPEKVRQGTHPCLSPMPKNKAKPHSPRKQVSAHHNIFVSPRKKDLSPKPEERKKEEGWFLYCHQRSSLSDLHAINDHIRRGVPSPVKRPAHSHQSPLLNAGRSPVPKPMEASGIMVQSALLGTTAQPLPAPSRADVLRRENVQRMLQQRAEARWRSSKGTDDST